MSESRTAHICALLLFSVLVCLLGVNAVVGNMNADELEHLHDTWLILQGKAPFVDFFEHHLPLTWYVIAGFSSLTRYVLPVEDPTLLLTSRLLSLYMLLLTAGLMYSLFRLFLPPLFATLVGFSFLSFLVSITAFVTRPESLAFPAVVGFLLVYFSENLRRKELLLAVCFALSFCFSPRVVFLLAPLILARAHGCWRKGESPWPLFLWCGFTTTLAVLGNAFCAGGFENLFVWVLHFSSNLRPELKLISSESVRAGLPIAWAFALGIACQGLRFRRVEVAAEVAVAPSTSKVREMTLFLCLLPVLFLALRVLRITKSDWYSAPFSPELFFGAFAAALVGLLGIKQERFRGMAKTLAIAFLVSTLGVVLERRPFIQSYFFPLTGYFLLLVIFLAAQVETFRESQRWASLQNWPLFCLLGFWSYFCYFEGWVTEAFLRYHLGLLREEMAQTAVPDDLPQQIDHLASFENFLRSLRLRQTLCSKLAGEVMYAGALNHPICLKDASYFWFGGGFMVAGTPYPKAVGNPVQAINRDILQRRPIFIATSFLDDFLVAPSPDSPTLVSPEYAGYQRLQNNFLRKD